MVEALGLCQRSDIMKRAPELWKVDLFREDCWGIVSESGRRVKIGPFNGKRTNYYDKAVKEAERRSALTQADASIWEG